MVLCWFRGNGSSGDEGNVRIWDVATGKLVRAFRNQHACSVAFSRDGKLLAIGDDKCVAMWDVKTGVRKAVFEGEAYVYSLQFSPGDTLLALAGYIENKIKICDPKTGQVKKALATDARV